MQLDSVTSDGNRLHIVQKADVFWVFPNKTHYENEIFKAKIFFRGQMPIAKNPPWDGGFTFSKDKNNKDWVAVSCQTEGLQLWLPCKNHPFDEPDSVRMKITHDYNNLKAVSNGKCISRIAKNAVETSVWEVKNKINQYNITINIGDYISFSDTLQRSDKSLLPLDFYVLSYNIDKAKQHFKQTKNIVDFLERTWGKYAFESEGYKIAETPYWGMEHQSCISYGNNYKNNNFGFDFIILHESAHEWWGNSISCADNADMWIHESLATYSEALFVEEKLGKEKMIAYLNTQKTRIENNFPQQGYYNVNFHDYPNSDMYFKGTWMWHTLRNIVADDVLWKSTLRKMYQTFAEKEVFSEEIIQFLNQSFKISAEDFFKIYLQENKPPLFYYKRGKLQIKSKCSLLNQAVWNDLKTKKLSKEEILNKYLILLKTD